MMKYLAFTARKAAAAALCVLAAGCASLPVSGPARQSIETQAITASRTSAVNIPYALVDISYDNITYLADNDFASLYTTFGEGRGGAPSVKIGVGDVIQVTIFESAPGGLFIPADAGARPGNYITLPQQTVDRSGKISIPYAGLISVSGRTQSEIQRTIESRLANRAIEPQAVVALINQRSTQVAVVGEVGAPSKIDLSPSGDRILDIVSRAGGIRHAGYETFVTLQRGGTRATVFFDTILRKPSENIYVRPGDTVYVSQEPRAFTAFGATGLSGRFTFDSPRLSLADAVAKAGGLLDNRADPRSVFVYRMEGRRTLQSMGVDLSRFAPDALRIPTVYRTNFRDPSGFFAAGNFPVRSQDILYVSNADAVELIKFLQLVTAPPNAVGAIADDVNAVSGVRLP